LGHFISSGFSHTLSLSHFVSIFSKTKLSIHTFSFSLSNPNVVSTLLANPSLSVVCEAGAPGFGGSPGNAAIVDEEQVVGVSVGGGVDLNEFNGGNEKRISGEVVEAVIEGGGRGG